jgi:small conductance mechanosensitive channel
MQAEADSSFNAWAPAVLMAIGIAIALTIPIRLLVRRFRRKLEHTPSTTGEINFQRIGTLTTALSNIGIVILWTVTILIVLDKLGVTIAPLLASAGIAGVALGFGAQSIVKDALSGFFILLEDQFGVGDVVELHTSAEPVEGKVESFTLRVTSLRSFDGTFHTVPNGNIQLVSNKSRGWARAIVDIRLAYGEDVDGVRRLLDDLFESLRADNAGAEWIHKGPSVLGVETMGDYGLVVRVIADTLPAKRGDIERLLRERIAARLEVEGVRTPLPPAIVHGAGRRPI